MTGTVGVLGGPALPYLRTRRDRFDARSPFPDWGPVRVALSSIRRAVGGVPAKVARVRVFRNDAARVTSIEFVRPNGSFFEVSGATFQQRLRLRSTYFELTPRYRNSRDPGSRGD